MPQTTVQPFDMKNAIASSGTLSLGRIVGLSGTSELAGGKIEAKLLISPRPLIRDPDLFHPFLGPSVEDRPRLITAKNDNRIGKIGRAHV